MSKNVKISRSLPGWACLSGLWSSLGHYNHGFHQIQCSRLTAIRKGLFKHFLLAFFFFFINYIHINLSPICIHLSSLLTTRHLHFYVHFPDIWSAINSLLTLFFFSLSLSLSPKEVLTVVWINPVTFRYKLTSKVKWLKLGQKVKVVEKEKNAVVPLIKQRSHSTTGWFKDKY